MLCAVVLCCFACTAVGQTNTLSDAEKEGQALVQKILEQQPAESSTNTGVLVIEGKTAKRIFVPVVFEIHPVPAGWQALYSTAITNADPALARSRYSQLTITHSDNRPNRYEVPVINPPPEEPFREASNRIAHLNGEQLEASFAGSDFWFCDLGLEFLHWPKQEVTGAEFYHNCACKILQSTNPNPSTNGYSRVQCWIDEDSLGIVKAYAYDRQGRKLKSFAPKKFEKIRGQYQLKSMEMINLQTDSISTLKFDLD